MESMGLELSPEKTHVTRLTDGFDFLGHRVKLYWDDRYGWTPRVEIPKAKTADLRYRVKRLTGRSTLTRSLAALLEELNPILRGWANFYRYCTGAKKILDGLDWYVGDRLWRWLRKKYPKSNAHQILRYRRSSRSRRTRRVWSDGGWEQFLMALLPVRRFRRGWMRTPDFALVSGEPDA